MKPKILMIRNTTRYLFEEQPGIRQLSGPDDAGLLGDLLYHAFHGSVDDEGESPADAQQEAYNTLHGQYGPVELNASFILMRNAGIVGCSIVCNWPKLHCPLLAFTATHPSFRKRGIATQLIQHTLNALSQKDIRLIGLFVSVDNIEARRLYCSLGFEQSEYERQGCI